MYTYKLQKKKRTTIVIKIWVVLSHINKSERIKCLWWRKNDVSVQREKKKFLTFACLSFLLLFITLLLLLYCLTDFFYDVYICFIFICLQNNISSHFFFVRFCFYWLLKDMCVCVVKHISASKNNKVYVTFLSHSSHIIL